MKSKGERGGEMRTEGTKERKKKNNPTDEDENVKERKKKGETQREGHTGRKGTREIEKTRQKHSLASGLSGRRL